MHSNAVVSSSDPSVATVPPNLTIHPGQSSVPFRVMLAAEGIATIQVMRNARVVTTNVEAVMPRSIVANPRSLRVAEGATATVTLSLEPAHSMPLTVTLTANPKLLSIPASATIPVGGEVKFEARAPSAGGTAIGVTSPAAGIIGTAVIVDVTPPVAKRRRSVR